MKKIIFVISALFLFVTSSYSQKDSHASSVFKYSPTQIFMGEFHFAYEQRIMPQASLELSFGPTISEIGFQSLMYDAFNWDAAERESNLGAFGALGFRFYPLSNIATAPYGFYIGPEFKYRLYRSNYIDSDYGKLQEKTGSISQLSFRFNTGYQFFIGDKFAIDVFTSVGVGSTDITSYRVLTTANQQGSFDYFWHEQKRNRVRFVGTIGVKIGFGAN